MVATGEGKDRHGATTREPLMMPRHTDIPGWVAFPGWQGLAAGKRRAMVADQSRPVDTVVPGVERAPGPVRVSCVRNAGTCYGSVSLARVCAAMR